MTFDSALTFLQQPQIAIPIVAATVVAILAFRLL